MDLKSVSASLDVIGNLSSLLGNQVMKFRKPWRGGKKVGVKSWVGCSIYQSVENRTIYGGKGVFLDQCETKEGIDRIEVKEGVNYRRLLLQKQKSDGR